MNNNKSDEGISGSGSNQASVANNGNRVLKLGLDMHYRQVTVAMQADGGRIKAAGKRQRPASVALCRGIDAQGQHR
jgi:urease beta subunit